MISDDFPLVLTPNLGCPRIVELGNGDVTIPLIQTSINLANFSHVNMCAIMPL